MAKVFSRHFVKTKGREQKVDQAKSKNLSKEKAQTALWFSCVRIFSFIINSFFFSHCSKKKNSVSSLEQPETRWFVQNCISTTLFLAVVFTIWPTTASKRENIEFSTMQEFVSFPFSHFISEQRLKLMAMRFVAKLEITFFRWINYRFRFSVAQLFRFCWDHRIEMFLMYVQL